MRRLDDEDGAAAVMIGLMLIVLLGFGAIAVDVGALFTERRELQNGADAAVLAVAQNCASGDAEPACDVGPQGNRLATARTFADANARDGSAAVAADGVAVDFAAARATVTTTSFNNGEGTVQHWFAPILASFSSDPDSLAATEVSAQSTAIWGPPAFGTFPTLPLTFSECEYAAFLDAGAGSAEAPWTVANNGAPQRIYLQGGNKHQPGEDCEVGPAGQDLPGGFGWLPDATTKSDKDQCEAEIVGGTSPADPGASSPCTKGWLEANLLNSTILLPVFSDVSKDGKTYTFSSYAAFYVTGYSFKGAGEPGKTGPCKNPLPDCIEGWFTTGSIPDGVVDPTAPDTGVRVVQLVLN
jgi:hypothetical protein